MKKLIYIILSALTLTACDLETSNNGALDGNWQLRKIDTLATGGTCDMSCSYIYWGVENNLLMVKDIDDSYLKILFRFERKGNELRIYSPHYVRNKDELIAIESDSLLIPLGIAGTEDNFLIEKLSSGNLVLKNLLYQLHFRKY